MVTILLPIYNDESFIFHTINSIKTQEYSDFKCLIGFNGTTDRSKEIVDDLTSKDARFVSLDYGEDKGKSKTLNKLLKLVETEYVSLIDGDDIWSTKKLYEQIEIRNKSNIIGTLTYYINEKNETINQIFLDESDQEIKSGFLSGHNQIINSSSFFKTKDALEINGWNEDFEGIEDFDFWIRLYRSGKTFHNIQKFLVFHRVHSGSNFNAKKLPYTVHDILIKNKIL